MNKFKRSVSFETDSESQPLLSSDSSNASFGAHHQIMFPGSETSDFDQSQSYLDSQRNQNQNSPFSKLNLKSLPQNVKKSEKKLNNFDDYQKKSIYTLPGSLQTKTYLSESNIYSVSSGENFDSLEKEVKNPKESGSTQSSMVTIFSIWNTTMGSSLLTMAWGINMAGFIPGLIIIILLGGLCLYTAYCCLQVSRDHGGDASATEIPALSRMLLGRWAQHLAETFSIVVLLGASIVYWILMSNFLYHSIQFIIDSVEGIEDEYVINRPSNVICPNNKLLNDTFGINIKSNVEQSNLGKSLWNLHSTVPVYLAVLLFPVLNCSNITFFTKFNCLGTLSVMYLIIFVTTKSAMWGINLNFNEEPFIKLTFVALTGMLSLSFFIHNIIISIVKNNRHQKHNGRDLSIAFCLITLTYLILGGVFYACFPHNKSCIEDNILNNFKKSDPMTLVARLLLLLQICVTFPLILYMLRINVFVLFVKKNKVQDENDATVEVRESHHTEIKFPRKWIILFNLIILIICILFACFLPKIGLLIRYTGALSGLVYIFTLPCLLKIASLKKTGKLTKLKLIFFIFIPICGAFNLFSQFFI